jgi:hypothetical protein
VAVCPLSDREGAVAIQGVVRTVRIDVKLASVNDTASLKPWMRGPFELLRHAFGHSNSGSDTDRRIALIGFDNAIEVCIDVYLRLHPKIRRGVEIPREEADKARVNYHTKLEFLDRHVAGNAMALVVPIETVIWYHTLRNELYHSGNGMVPELHVVEGALEAAISVFEALFGVNPRPLLHASDQPKEQLTVIREAPSIIDSPPKNDQMEFLRVFIEFEKALAAATGTALVGLPLRERWRAYQHWYGRDELKNKIVREAISIRNRIVHGSAVELTDEFVNVYVMLPEITSEILATVSDVRSDIVDADLEVAESRPPYLSIDDPWIAPSLSSDDSWDASGAAGYRATSSKKESFSLVATPSNELLAKVRRR